MSGQENAKEDLISGILEEAQREADMLVDAAQKTSAERQRAAEKQVAAILEDARKNAAQKKASLEEQNEKAIASARRQRTLKAQEQLLEEVLAEVTRRISSAINEPRYRVILLGWVVEAAIGLDAARAEVNASEVERAYVDDRFLADAAEEVFRLTAQKIELTKSKADALLEQGVVLETEEGRVFYNNQISARLKRFESEIRKMIYTALFDHRSLINRRVRE